MLNVNFAPSNFDISFSRDVENAILEESISERRISQPQRPIYLSNVPQIVRD
jgi:hypothetical protein